MDEVTDADAVAVAVAAGDDDVQVMVGKLDTGGHGDGASVQAVNAVGMNEARQV